MQPKEQESAMDAVAMEMVQIASFGIQGFRKPAVLYLLIVSGGEGLWAWGLEVKFWTILFLCEIMDRSLNGSRSQFLHL